MHYQAYIGLAYYVIVAYVATEDVDIHGDVMRLPLYLNDGDDEPIMAAANDCDDDHAGIDDDDDDMMMT